MHTRYSLYMILFSLIIFGWALGMVALILYVRRSGETKVSRVSNFIQSPTQSPIYVPTTLSPTQFQSEEEFRNSKFGQLLTPTP